MPSPKNLAFRSLPVALVLAAGVLAAAQPAAAIPLIGIGASAAAFGTAFAGAQSGLGYDLDASLDVFGFEAAGNMVGNLGGPQSLIEFGLRREISFLPMISIKPYVGYQTQSFFGNGTLDSGPQARLDVGFSPILLPVWFEGNAGVSFPLSYQHPLAGYMVGGYFSPLPVLALGVRYRAFRELSGTGEFGAAELGLRVSI